MPVRQIDGEKRSCPVGPRQITSCKGRARGDWFEFSQFVSRLERGSALLLQFQRRSPPCSAPTALPPARCISLRRNEPLSTKSDLGSRIADRQRRKATLQDKTLQDKTLQDKLPKRT